MYSRHGDVGRAERRHSESELTDEGGRTRDDRHWIILIWVRTWLRVKRERENLKVRPVYLTWLEVALTWESTSRWWPVKSKKVE